MAKYNITVTLQTQTRDSLINAYQNLDSIIQKEPIDFNNIDNFSRFTDKILQIGLSRIGYYHTQ